jgi:hypothetical protein
MRKPATLLSVGLGSAFLLAAGAPEPPAAPALHVISDRMLPPGLEKATDVRWASDKTVYLSLREDGTVEAPLDPGGPAIKEWIPGRKTLGGWTLNHRVGASHTYLVSAGPIFGLTWRALNQPLRKEASFDFLEDVDVSGNRLLVLGAQRDAKGKFAPDGTIVWLGSLDKGLSDLRSVLLDARGVNAPNLNACGNFEMGGVRFLSGGSFLVVPGVQPGAYLYDSDARLVRTWDTVGLGLDSDCASLGLSQVLELAHNFDARVAWLNRRRTLDEILPLPEGPGLVVRSVVLGRPRWQLKVLRTAGGIATYDLPIPPDSARSHLRGDVRGDAIVFLLHTYEASMRKPERPPSRLILAKVPGH